MKSGSRVVDVVYQRETTEGYVVLALDTSSPKVIALEEELVNVVMTLQRKATESIRVIQIRCLPIR